MKLIIAGGTGFLGQALEKYFTEKNWEVGILTRHPQASNHIRWDGYSLGPWTQELEDSTLLINLCGRSVDCRYTAENKKAIMDSRIKPTRLLHEALARLEQPPTLFMNASSATAYVHSEDLPMTESRGVQGHDFSMTVVRAWEKAFFASEIEGMRQVALRTSIVLGSSGGAWPKLKWLTRLGMGGQQGNGQQMVSWIHVDDFCRALHFIVENRHLEGIINVTGPTPMTNRAFMQAIRKRFGIPLGLSQPRWLLELGAWIMRTESELLLKSRYVQPERLEKSGFTWNHSDLSQV